MISFWLAFLQHTKSNITQWHNYSWLGMHDTTTTTQNASRNHNQTAIQGTHRQGMGPPQCFAMMSKIFFFFAITFHMPDSYPWGCNAWNWHRHKQHQQIDDQQIDTNTTTSTIISLYHIAPNLFHLVKVGSACLWGLLSGPLGPSPWRHKTITNTYTDTYIHWQYIEATHCLCLCLSSSSFITASALQSTEQHEPTQQTRAHGQDTH